MKALVGMIIGLPMSFELGLVLGEGAGSRTVRHHQVHRIRRGGSRQAPSVLSGDAHHRAASGGSHAGDGLAIGAGSLFFSHVNDGFWLTKEYFALSVGQTIESWSIMETILSVTGIALVLALSVVV